MLQPSFTTNLMQQLSGCKTERENHPKDSRRIFYSSPLLAGRDRKRSQ